MAEIAWYFCLLTPFKRKWQNKTDRKKKYNEISLCCSRKTQHLKLSPIINVIFKKILNELA